MKNLKKMTGLLRKICAHSPPKGSTPNRKQGICAIVKLRNEPFIEPSLISIKDLVDEYIIVDCSTDDTPKKVKKVTKEHGLNLKYVHMEMDHYKQYKTAIELSTREWLLVWDGDFIAYLAGRRDIRKLKDLINKLPKEKFFFIEFQVFDVELDLLHTNDTPYHLEAYLFKYSPLLMELSFLRILRNSFRRVIGKRPFRSPHLPFPFWYERYILNQVFAMHLRSVKSPLRVLERKYQTDWALSNDEIKQKFSNSFEEFLQYFVKRDFNEDMEKVAQNYAEILMKERNLIPYNIEVYGDYPIVLKRMIKETLGIEINQTQEFKNKITSFLLKENTY